MYEFCNRNINKFILLLKKGVYPYEYMDSWERFYQGLLTKKDDFKVALTWKISQVLIIGMQKKYLKALIIKV